MNKMRDQHGSVLVTILVLAIVSAIVFYSISALILSQNKENQANQEKINSVELESFIVSSLGDGLACRDQFNTTNYLFNPLNPVAINFNQISRLAAPPVIQTNMNPTGRLIIQGIQIQMDPVAVVPTSNIFSGRLIVNLSTQNLIRIPKPIQISMKFGAVAAGGGNYRLIACGSEINVCSELGGIFITGVIPPCRRPAFIK